MQRIYFYKRDEFHDDFSSEQKNMYYNIILKHVIMDFFYYGSDFLQNISFNNNHI